MPKGNKNLGNFGSKIMAEAKKIKQEKPELKWQECVKLAGKNLKKEDLKEKE